MPGFDGTGPGGRGPMTGWGRGYCSESTGYGRPEYRTYGRSGGSRGRGWRNQYWLTGVPAWARWGSPVRFEPELTKQEQMKMLQEEAKNLESELDHVKKELEKLNKSGNKDK